MSSESGSTYEVLAGVAFVLFDWRVGVSLSGADRFEELLGAELGVLFADLRAIVCWKLVE